MTNKLCEAGCLGFPVAGAGNPDPATRVVCRNGDLVVEHEKTWWITRLGGLDQWAYAGVVSGQTVTGGYIQPQWTNPYRYQVGVSVMHQFAFGAALGPWDHFEVWGDINISGGVLYTGAANGQFLLFSQDGNTWGQLHPVNQVDGYYNVFSFEMLYFVGGYATFSIGQLARLVCNSVGPYRSVTQLGTSMTVRFAPNV